MMTELFLLQIQVGILVLFLLILRLGMKKMPKIYSYILWLLVFVRLLIPAGFESRIGILPSQAEGAGWIHSSLEKIQTMEDTESMQEGFAAGAEMETVQNQDAQRDTKNAGAAIGDWFKQQSSVPTVVFLLWLTGLTGILGYNILALVRIRRRIRGAAEQEENVYVSEFITAPFTIGLKRPKIYLPASLSGAEREYILYHERVHIRRRDYIIKNMTFLLSCIYWFNPFVWAAFYMMEHDMEMSCDEAVVKAMGGGIKKQYSQSLLNFAAGSQRAAVTPLTFGEVSVKQRVKNVLSYKDRKKWIGIVGILILTVAGIVIFTTREQKPEEVSQIGQGEMRQFQTSPEELLNRWGQAVVDRDGDVLSGLFYEPEKLKHWDIDTARFYEVVYEEKEKTGVIRYQMYLSKEDIYIAQERIWISEKENLYYVKDREWTEYDCIDTAEEFGQAYGTAPRYDFMFHSYDFWREIFRQLRSGENPEHYGVYSDPVLSAKRLLHLGEGTGRAEYPVQGEGQTPKAVVTYTFKDGGTVEIPMYRIEPSEEIWALDTDRGISFDVYEEISGLGGVKYQATPFGIYRVAENEMTCIYPYYVGTQPELELNAENLYFKTFSQYREGDLDWEYDCTMYIDLKTGEVAKE